MNPAPKRSDRGQRKLTHAREMACILTAGICLLAFMKAPNEIVWAYATAMGGISGAFVWGNRGEHLASAKTNQPQQQSAQ